MVEICHGARIDRLRVLYVAAAVSVRASSPDLESQSEVDSICAPGQRPNWICRRKKYVCADFVYSTLRSLVDGPWSLSLTKATNRSSPQYFRSYPQTYLIVL